MGIDFTEIYLMPLYISRERQVALMRQKRYLGITAGMTVVISVAATRANLSGSVTSQSVTTASTVYKPSGEVSDSLSTQSSLNNLIQMGILNLHQQSSLNLFAYTSAHLCYSCQSLYSSIVQSN